MRNMGGVGMGARPRPREKGFTLIELMIVVAVLGIVAAIAVPNYIRFQAKSRQSEARTSLAAIYVAEVAHYTEFRRFGSFSEIGFALSGSANRFTYRSPAVGGNAGSSNTAGIDYIPAGFGGTTPDNTTWPSAASAAVSNVSFTATATGDLDNDPTLDEWHVNDIKQDLKVPDSNDVIT